MLRSGWNMLTEASKRILGKPAAIMARLATIRLNVFYAALRLFDEVDETRHF
jgi:hypothetical protein